MTKKRESNTPPSFDPVFDDEDVERRIYGRILQTRKPVSAGAVAKAVECDPKTARKYLSWFSELGVVTTHEGHPTTYERNDAYFEWRRINELASTNSREELQHEVSRLTDRITTYRERYDVESPGDVDVLSFDDSDVDTVYEDLGDWATIQRERQLYERARQQVTGSATGMTG